jgi:F-type H+-transporting ATPase subunit a
VPEHTSFLTFILQYGQHTLAENARRLGLTFIGRQPATWHSFEPIMAAFLVFLLLIGVGLLVRQRVQDAEAHVIPEERLTLLNFVEVFLGYFYDLAKSIMGHERAKKYFPVIGTSASFVFTANALALIPGAPVPTSSFSITLGSAFVVFILFNAYGIKENGWGYVKHLCGPSWGLAPLLFVIEVISLFVRPFTLALRLMMNMAVDHLIVGIFGGLVAIFVPLPFMVLGCLVLVVQTLVFTMLTCVYIGQATEHEAH